MWLSYPGVGGGMEAGGRGGRGHEEREREREREEC